MIIKHSSFLFKRKTILERSFSRNAWRTTIAFLSLPFAFEFRHFCSRLLLLPNVSGVRCHELRFQMEDRGAVQVQEMRVQLRGLQGKVAKQDQQPNNVPRCGNNHNVVPHRGEFGAVQVPDIDVQKHLKGDDAYIKFYQLLSGIKTLLGHKEMGIKSKQQIEHRKKVRQPTLF